MDDKRNLEKTLTSAQKKAWYSIKKGIIEMKKLDKSGKKGRPVEELLSELGVKQAPCSSL